MRRRTSCRSWIRSRRPARRSPAQAKALDELLLSAVGFSQCGHQHDRREPAEPGERDERAGAHHRRCLIKYSPTYTCLFQGAQWFLEHGGRDALGGNGKSVIMDAALLLGDDPYRYPDNLPQRSMPRAARWQAELRLAAGRQPELPGEVSGDRHRVRHRPGHPAQPRHRLPRLRQLLPGHQGQCRSRR